MDGDGTGTPARAPAGRGACPVGARPLLVLYLYKETPITKDPLKRSQQRPAWRLTSHEGCWGPGVTTEPKLGGILGRGGSQLGGGSVISSLLLPPLPCGSSPCDSRTGTPRRCPGHGHAAGSGRTSPKPPRCCCGIKADKWVAQSRASALRGSREAGVPSPESGNMGCTPVLLAQRRPHGHGNREAQPKVSPNPGGRGDPAGFGLGSCCWQTCRRQGAPRRAGATRVSPRCYLQHQCFL